MSREILDFRSKRNALKDKGICARLKAAREKIFPGRGGPALLSKRTGISTGRISEYENGVAVPGSEKLAILVKALGCTADSVLFGNAPDLELSKITESQEAYGRNRIVMEVVLPAELKAGDRIVAHVVKAERQKGE